ncbi:hypothetical protein Tco_1048954 [Tanacetum coccineum]
MNGASLLMMNAMCLDIILNNVLNMLLNLSKVTIGNRIPAMGFTTVTNEKERKQAQTNNARRLKNEVGETSSAYAMNKDANLNKDSESDVEEVYVENDPKGASTPSPDVNNV